MQFSVEVREVACPLKWNNQPPYVYKRLPDTEQAQIRAERTTLCRNGTVDGESLVGCPCLNKIIAVAKRTRRNTEPTSGEQRDTFKIPKQPRTKSQTQKNEGKTKKILSKVSSLLICAQA